MGEEVEEVAGLSNYKMLMMMMMGIRRMEVVEVEAEVASQIGCKM